MTATAALNAPIMSARSAEFAESPELLALNSLSTDCYRQRQIFVEHSTTVDLSIAA